MIHVWCGVIIHWPAERNVYFFCVISKCAEMPLFQRSAETSALLANFHKFMKP